MHSVVTLQLLRPVRKTLLVWEMIDIDLDAGTAACYGKICLNEIN